MSAPAQYVVSLTVDAVFDALGAYLAPFVSPAEIIRCQVNRTSYPIGDFVELTEISNTDLEYPRQWYDTVNLQRDIIGPKRMDIQADFYGESAGDWCAAIKTVWRTSWSVAQFPSGMAPLYCDDGHEMPFITGEDQYTRRWTLTLSIQYNPIVVLPQQSADVLSMNILNDVDA